LYEELSDCLRWWKKRQEGPQAWKVAATNLIERDSQGNVIAVNLDIKNPHAKEGANHRAPEEIIEGVIAKERDLLRILKEIKTLIAERT
jgi:type I restriction enzyme M protein